MSDTLHLREIQTVIDETGLSRERILELRAMPEPQGHVSFRLLADWADANALDPTASLAFCHRILERIGPRTGHREHDTGTGPIQGITGLRTVENIRTGYGPCQHCNHVGELRLVAGRWLCDQDARRSEARDRFRAMVKAA